MKDDSNGHIQQIELERIRASPTNPRKTFDPVRLNELAETVKSQGILCPILLRPMPGWEIAPGNQDGKPGFFWHSNALKAAGGFVKAEKDADGTRPMEIVAGERRFRAAKLAGLKTIPAIVRDMTDRQVLEVQMIENEQREDVLPSERAAAYRRLHDSGTPVEEIAGRIGKSVSTVRDLLKIGRLPVSVLEPLDRGSLPLSVAVLLARIPGEAAREKATSEILKGSGWSGDSEPMSFRAAKAHIERAYTVELKQAPFSQADKKLLPAGGSCKDCPKRVGNLAKEDPEAYAGARADVCTDPECFRAKKAAHLIREQARLVREGIDVSEYLTRHRIPCPALEEDERANLLEPQVAAVSKWIDNGAAPSQTMALLADLAVTRFFNSAWEQRETAGALRSKAWERDVRDAAMAATEGERRIEVSGAFACYEVAPLRIGLWAVTFSLRHTKGSAGGQSHPWKACASRQACIDAFLAAARKFFETRGRDNPAGARSGKAMLAKLGKDFVEPEPAESEAAHA